MLVLALLATAISGAVSVSGQHPLEASAIAILLGLALRNSTKISPALMPGIKANEKILIWAIILLGASLNFSSIINQGLPILGIIAVTMILGFWLIYWVGLKLSLPPRLGMLLAVGTTICGGTAIAITAPLIRAKEEETSFAIAVITLWGIIATLAYPIIGHALSVSDTSFGVFAGTAIHSTPQVVGAAYMFSDAAGKLATAVKLIRNCFIAPLALIIALRFNRNSEIDNQVSAGSSLKRAFPWFLFGYFAMAGLNSANVLGPNVIDYFVFTGKFLIPISMAGIGLNTSLSSLKSLGWKPVVTGSIGTIVVAAVSIAMIQVTL